MGQLVPRLEGRPVGDDLVPDVLLEVGLHHIVLLQLYPVQYYYVDQPLYLVPWDLQLLLYPPHLLLGQKDAPVLADLPACLHGPQLLQPQDLTAHYKLQLLVVPEALVLKAGNLGSDLEAVAVQKGYFVDNVYELLPVA